MLIPALELDFDLRAPDGRRLADALAALRWMRACAGPDRRCELPVRLSRRPQERDRSVRVSVQLASFSSVALLDAAAGDHAQVAVAQPADHGGAVLAQSAGRGPRRATR